MNQGISFQDFLRKVEIPMFGFAIVNPMGPTFMGFAIGKKNSKTANLMFFTLNPFSQTAEEVSTYDFDPQTVDVETMLEDFDITSDIDDFLAQKKSCQEGFSTPTLFLGNLGGETESFANEQQLIIMSCIRHSHDPIRTLENLNLFPMDVMHRVSHEMQNMFSVIANDASGLKHATDEELMKIVAHICNLDHIKQEFKGFNIAWTGAINFQEENGNVSLVKTAVKLEEAIPIIAKLCPPLFALMAEDYK